MLIFIFAIPGRGAPSTNSDFLRRQVNYLSVAMRTTYVFFTGVATAQSIINEGEEGTLGLVRFGFSLVAGTKGRRTCQLIALIANPAQRGERDTRRQGL